MKRVTKTILVCGMALICYTGDDITLFAQTKVVNQVDFSQVRIQDDLWLPRLKKRATNTLPVCIDQVENKIGWIRSLEDVAKNPGKHSGIFYDGSGAYKTLEGIAYSLINNPNPELGRKADEWIDKMTATQPPDGYINTFYTLTGLGKRWTNTDKYGIYCAGYIIEVAAACYKATGKRMLLNVSTHMVNHMMTLSGPDRHHWVPGHKGIELTPAKLA